MNEADVRLKVKHALEALGYHVDTQMDAVICPKCGTKIVPPIGKPDLSVLAPARSFYVEVKVLRAGKTSFPFKDITVEQRDWLDTRTEEGFQGYLALGVIRQHGKVQMLDRLYLVDWIVWLRVEGWLSTIQDSIPFSVDRCRSKLLKEKGWDILTLLPPWGMEYRDRLWRLRKSHSAHIRRIDGREEVSDL